MFLLNIDYIDHMYFHWNNNLLNISYIHLETHLLYNQVDNIYILLILLYRNIYSNRIVDIHYLLLVNNILVDIFHMLFLLHLLHILFYKLYKFLLFLVL